MPLDPKWTAFAENDLRSAQVLLREKIWNQVCFHAQQAAEKYLKGSISPEARPRSHKIASLLTLTNLELPAELRRDLRLLDRFYIPTRYPDALPGSLEDCLPTETDAKAALQTAEDLADFIESRLP